ncbi:hypothetical protein GQ54DRAFT_333075 [Martensiomyces pterosporus]|nr:hypothetical protein GQ54DRAFT_333075 [Martensiomyces pterosporus]
MCKHRDIMVRRAVARHIAQRTQLSRIAKHRRSGSGTPSSAAATAAAAAAATITSAAACPAATAEPHTGLLVDNESMASIAYSDAEVQLIQRIVELQQEKERLLRAMQQTV